MIKLRNSGIVMISLLILLGSCFTAAATSISDGTGDIWHWVQSVSGTGWSWQGNVGNKPNIDITEVSYTVNDNKITLSLKVSGTIQTSDKVIYMVYYNSTDTHYYLSYTNGSAYGWGMKGMTNFTSEQNVTISGGTISVVLDVLGDTSKVELWGWAHEYTTVGTDQTMNEWWGDWAPNSKLPFTPDTGGNTDNNTGGDTTGGNNTNGNNTGTKTPGFEVLPVIAAVAIAAIFLRKRR